MTPNPAMMDRETALVLEKVSAGYDLEKLSAQERNIYYRARCDAAGLDPRTQPFQFIKLNGRLVLYATKAATDQLVAANKLSVTLVEETRQSGLFQVKARVTFPDGRQVEDLAAVWIEGLQGEALANALMKASTKAKRRTVLSACGLGMLDETELESIPMTAREPVAVDQETGEVQMPHPPSEIDHAPVLPQPDKTAVNRRMFAVAAKVLKEVGITETRDIGAALDRWVEAKTDGASRKELTGTELTKLLNRLDTRAEEVTLLKQLAQGPPPAQEYEIPPF